MHITTNLRSLLNMRPPRLACLVCLACCTLGSENARAGQGRSSHARHHAALETRTSHANPWISSESYMVVHMLPRSHRYSARHCGADKIQSTALATHPRPLKAPQCPHAHDTHVWPKPCCAFLSTNSSPHEAINGQQEWRSGKLGFVHCFDPFLLAAYGNDY